MADLNRPTKGRKGFYVRMRFLHSNYRHGRPKENGNGFFFTPNKKGTSHFCFRCVKWVLWVFLSLYFFTSLSSISKNAPSPLSTVVPRSLFESSVANANANFSSSSEETVKGLKMYIYDLPGKYNNDWLSNERCRTHLFASEVAIHKALLKSDVRTFDPFEADFFFVPVYVSCNFSTINGFPAIGHARTLISSAVRLISEEFPFWNRSRGSDHVFVASHDFGSCFHTLEDVAMADGVPEVVRKSIILQTFGVKYRHPCQDVENVVIPPYIPPETVRSTLEKRPLDGNRDIFAFFRGKMELNPKNVSGRFYSKAVRTKIWKKYNNDRRFYLRRHRFAGYQSEIVRSVFCLCPLGWAPWSPRLVESVALGCVPVIIADGIRLPFDDVVPWSEISLTVPENDVVKLGSILDHVARTNLTDIQRNLWDPAVRRALLFNDRIEKGDATWQVLASLAHNKLNRSYRRSGVITQ